MKIKYLLTLVLAAVSTFGYGAVITEVPDKEGMNVKGLVKCGDEPVAGVQVSDGVAFTQTDANGHYWLASDKECGYVFICNPDGYKNIQIGQYPQFYKFLNSGISTSGTERIDFELEKETSRDYAVVFVADPQLARRYYDWQQFERNAVPDINKTVENYQSQGRSVYCITLGDLGFNSYELLHDVAKENLEKLKVNTFYNCMGNHDNQLDATGDWATTLSYRNYFGPTYYSFNAGGIHYIVLDNIEIPEGNDGDHYTENITTQVLKWFRNDLKNVDKSTQVIVCMHALLFHRQQVDSSGNLEAAKYRYSFGTKFAQSLTGYKNVKIFTGHAHNNHIVTKSNMTEYNVGSVSGNIWITGYFVQDNLVCCDGSPAGYRVMEVTDGEIETYNKCIGFDRNYQFRAYDMNQCYITPEKFAPNIGDPNWMITEMANKGWGYDASTDFNGDGSPKVPNLIRVKVFAPSTEWKIEIFENGKSLPVRRLSGYDPYQIISDFGQRMNLNWGSGGHPTKNSHFFDAVASSPTSTVLIKVTDEYGNVYTETMQRPKEFSMKQYISTGPEGYSAVNEIYFDDKNGLTEKEELYNLNGLKVNNSTLIPGIYIKRKGNKSTKIVIK